MSPNPDSSFRLQAERLGFDIDAELKPGGNYLPCVVDGNHVYISGQICRDAKGQILTGRVGDDTTLEAAKAAAEISAIRGLLLLRQAAGSLDNVAKIVKVSVFTRCTADYTQLSEVADGASDLLKAILGDASGHARTSVGVYSLPKGAMVEIELIARLKG